MHRSRFITTVAHAPSADSARSFVERVRQEIPDATHHCWAFVAGPPGNTMHIGMSDDGEPHGTAGRPMLTALLHGGIGEVVAVVSRYFGGTKLGTGGLARAYADGVRLALESLPTDRKVDRTQLEVTAGYPHVDALRRLIDGLGGRILEEDYGSEVRYRIAVPTSERETFMGMLADLTSGEATLTGPNPNSAVQAETQQRRRGNDETPS